MNTNTPTNLPSWQLLVDAIASEPDPRRRRNMEIVAEHVVHEVAGDIPALLATLVPEPTYRFWGPTESRPAQGQTAVEAHYRSLIQTGKNRLEFHITRVIADHDNVVTEGEFRFAYRGRDVTMLSNAPERPVDENARYLVAIHCLIVWPISPEGLILGEDIFAGEPPRVIRQLEPGEMPHLGLPSPTN
ncbi:nuclear transport factor 2 family protein [Nocardia neocaledoniensis]|uniref:nuclear transport factor 2 family protein n=1 Tax=Nocardia neocaledoniensis TaxID=236511 RepID=UPI0024579529|nr:nuclear transport factor 2 family protein [Nocardia neocaledoniensis]